MGVMITRRIQIILSSHHDLRINNQDRWKVAGAQICQSGPFRGSARCPAIRFSTKIPFVGFHFFVASRIVRWFNGSVLNQHTEKAQHLILDLRGNPGGNKFTI